MDSLSRLVVIALMTWGTYAYGDACVIRQVNDISIKVCPQVTIFDQKQTGRLEAIPTKANLTQRFHATPLESGDTVQLHPSQINGSEPAPAAMDKNTAKK